MGLCGINMMSTSNKQFQKYKTFKNYKYLKDDTQVIN